MTWAVSVLGWLEGACNRLAARLRAENLGGPTTENSWRNLLTGAAAPTGTAIALCSRTAAPIDNVQDRELPADRLRAAGFVKETFVRGKTYLVNGPSGYYNCAGLAFASRRTQIVDMARIWSILAEDGYGEIFSEMESDVGDIVVYARGANCEHVGFVVGRGNPPLEFPRVLSKLSWAIEIVHYAHEGPYHDCQRRYYRVRNYDISN